MTVKTTNGKYPLTRIELSDDFIVEHLNTFFLPEETEEVIEEENIDDLLEKDEDTASGAVVAIISGEVSYDDAVEILEMLIYSDDEYEIPIANYNVLDNPVTAGIAADVIRLIPWTGFVMDETGDLPTKVTYIGKVISVIIGGFVQFVVGVTDVLVEGFLALAGFIGALVDIVVDWGLKLWRGIVEFFSDVRAAVSEVVELVGALFDWLIDWVKEQLTTAFNLLVEPLKKRIEGFYDSLAAAISDAYQEYEETGSLSTSTQNSLNSLLDFTWITVVIAGLIAAIEVIAITAGSASFGVGYLAITLISPFIALLAAKLFTGDESYSTMELPGLDKTSIDFDYIIDFVRDKVNSEDEDSMSIIMSDQEEKWGVFWGFVSVLFGIWSWILTTAGTIKIPGLASITSAVIGAVAWWIFGIAAVLFGGTTAGFVLGGLALVLGAASLIGSLIAAKFSTTAGQKGMLGIGVLFGGVATYFGYKSLT